jgi:cell division protein FtsW (lipid II flippase)
MRMLNFTGAYGLSVLVALISFIVMAGSGATWKDIVGGICSGVFTGVAMIFLAKMVIDEIEEGRR